MQPGFNADFWASLGLFAFVVGAPIAAITTIVVMWIDVTTRARSLRAGGPNPWDGGFFVGIATTAFIVTSLNGFALGAMWALCFALMWRVAEELCSRRSATQSEEDRITAIAWRVGLVVLTFLAVHALAFFSFVMAGLLVAVIVRPPAARRATHWYEAAPIGIATATFAGAVFQAANQRGVDFFTNTGLHVAFASAGIGMVVFEVGRRSGRWSTR